MARYMRDTGVLSRLGIPDVPPDNPKRVHRSLKQHNLGSGKVVNRWVREGSFGIWGDSECVHGGALDQGM
eukprot:scaffold93452_cov19-Tisochrysis_lutea.AAC.3